MGSQAIIHPFLFQGAPRIAPIAALVLAVHLALILWLIVAAPAKNLLSKPKARVVVQTVQLSTPKPKTSTHKIEEWSTPVQMPETVSIEETPPAEIQPMPKLEESQVKQPQVVDIPQPQIKSPVKPKEKPKPVPKKVEKTKAAPKKKAQPKETPKEKAVPKEKPVSAAPMAKQEAQKAAAAAAQKAKQQELLAKAQESIAKIRRDGVTIDAKQRADLKIPQLTLATVAADEASSLSMGEVSYRDELAGRLKLLLKLPEYGSVKLKLTLQRSGKVSKVAIVSAGSAQNRAYVEKLMPTLQFPPFGTQFGQDPEYTFTITLNNDF